MLLKSPPKYYEKNITRFIGTQCFNCVVGVFFTLLGPFGLAQTNPGDDGRIWAWVILFGGIWQISQFFRVFKCYRQSYNFAIAEEGIILRNHLTPWHEICCIYEYFCFSGAETVIPGDHDNMYSPHYSFIVCVRSEVTHRNAPELWRARKYKTFIIYPRYFKAAKGDIKQALEQYKHLFADYTELPEKNQKFLMRCRSPMVNPTIAPKPSPKTT